MQLQIILSHITIKALLRSLHPTKTKGRLCAHLVCPVIKIYSEDCPDSSDAQAVLSLCYRHRLSSMLFLSGCGTNIYNIIADSFRPCYMKTLFEPRCEKTSLRGFRPGQTQTELHSHRRWLETWNFGFKKKRDCTIRVAVTTKLICTFVFAYAISRFSHNEAHLSLCQLQRGKPA